MKLTYKEWAEVIGLLKSELRETEKSLEAQREIIKNLDHLIYDARENENWTEVDALTVKSLAEERTERHYLKRCQLLDGIIEKLENQEI